MCAQIFLHQNCSYHVLLVPDRSHAIFKTSAPLINLLQWRHPLPQNEFSFAADFQCVCLLNVKAHLLLKTCCRVAMVKLIVKLMILRGAPYKMHAVTFSYCLLQYTGLTWATADYSLLRFKLLADAPLYKLFVRTQQNVPWTDIPARYAYDKCIRRTLLICSKCLFMNCQTRMEDQTHA